MKSAGDWLSILIANPNMASKAWIYQQYDQRVMNDTLASKDADAALVRVHKTDKALAITTDCNSHYCHTNPERGAAFAVAEAYRNLCAVGAKPLAFTNNLNYGNPEKPEIMGQIVLGIRGITSACKALETPIVSGNVSLYNETDGQAILPTPVIGGVGLKSKIQHQVGLVYRDANMPLVRVGPVPTVSDLGQSALQRWVWGEAKGDIPCLDLALERKTGRLICQAIESGWIAAVHDVSDGGTLTALAEMALASGMGANLSRYQRSAHAYFGETCATYIVALPEPALLLAQAAAEGIHTQVIGTTGGDRLSLADGEEISLEKLRLLHGEWMPTYMN